MNLRRWWTFLQPGWAALAGGCLCLLVVAAIELSLPLFFGKGVVDRVLLAADAAFLTRLAVGGVVLFIVKGLFTYGQVYLLALAGHRAVRDLRHRLYARLLRLPLSFHARHRAGELIASVTSDVGVIQNAISAGLGDLVQHSLTLAGIVVIVFVLQPGLALVTLLTLPLAALAIQAYGRRIRHFSGRLQARIADLTASLFESLDGIRVIKAFGLEAVREERLAAENERGYRASLRSAQAMATVTPVVELILVGGMMLVVWVGGRAVVAGHLTPGELLSFLAYLGMASRPLGLITRSLNLLQQALASAQRVQAILEEEQEVPDRPGARSLGEVRGQIAFDGVWFSYPGAPEPSLRGIHLTVEPGEVLALVGPSGAGKTTLVNLIPRFYDPTAGRVLLDGVDLRELQLASLRRQIGLVPQETVLFGESVADNIAAGRPATREEVERAARLAGAHDFIAALPEGYDTVLGDRGATLSGGQRQRIAIARAVLADPRILILDEATSNLDAESEAAIRGALARLRGQCTILIIAHRLATVRAADRIAVLEGGRVVELGNHEALLAQQGLYSRLYRLGEAVGLLPDEAEEVAAAAAQEGAGP